MEIITIKHDEIGFYMYIYQETQNNYRKYYKVKLYLNVN